jgi:branched-subunit amino acid transport protein
VIDRVWVTIVVAGIGTYAMRASFLAVAHRLATVPPGVQRLLRQIPPAALASIVVPALVRPHGDLGFHAELVAGLVATAVAWKTRNIALTLVLGMGVLLVLRAR